MTRMIKEKHNHEGRNSATFPASSHALHANSTRVKSPKIRRRGGLPRSALISKISLQFIAFFTSPFISEISRAPAKISHQYAERSGEEKTCRERGGGGKTDSAGRGMEGGEWKKECQEKNDEQTDEKVVLDQLQAAGERSPLFSAWELLTTTCTSYFYSD